MDYRYRAVWTDVDRNPSSQFLVWFVIDFGANPFDFHSVQLGLFENFS